ncbi:hypothetical protein ACFE04_026363 [Oxalis oulophora]
MAVVGPTPAITEPVRYSDITVTDVDEQVMMMIEEEEDKVFVALGKEAKENKSILRWTLHNYSNNNKKLCIIHVHQPSQFIPFMGAKMPASRMKQQEVKAYHQLERQHMEKMLNEYLLTCRTTGVRAETLYIEMDSIEKGIMELISKHAIKKLVMGAAADKHYSKKMVDLKSKKAITVRAQAPAYCQICFVCKGNLILTREGSLAEASPGPGSSSHHTSPEVVTGRSTPMRRSQSLVQGQSREVKLTNPAQDLFRRIRSTSVDGHAGIPLELISPDRSTIGSRLDIVDSSDELDGLSRRSPSQDSIDSSFSRVDVPSSPRTENSGNWLSVRTHPSSKQNFNHSSPPSVLDGSTDDALYHQLQQVMAEASNSRKEAFEEAVRRGKAERNAIDAIRKARASEALYNEELKLRNQIEEALSKEKEELEKAKKQKDEVMKELQTALDQKSLIESQIAESDESVRELEQKIISAVELLQTYKNDRDELQIERDNAIKEAEELRKSRADPSAPYLPHVFSEFSFLEIEEATQSFNPSLKIGEGGYGSIYRGVLRHTEVAIKMLHAHSLQGPSEFQQEVNVLTKMRHPNLVTLIGACPEAWILIYEYLANGSLEDRLSCKDNSPPLSWQSRIRIASELCSVLMFLHSTKPLSIIHGDLKPANILLDANLVSKLSDFGICRLLSDDEFSSNHTTLCCKTDPKGTFAYMDPELLSTGELTPKSDVYSFGIILLRLLTGREALGLVKEVQCALDKGDLKNVLDPLAGDWPFVQAEQLARLALRCCEMNRRNRPDLGSEVFRVLEPMRASCGGSLSFRRGPDEHCRPPHYFICPIFQEVMQDPHVAADGFTYEAEALKGWLDSGHETSPMTNLKLAHNNLVPNRALRSAIQEWLQEN